ncbi:hypothetical protein PC129_g13064 [Phytophthora cactorum]|uniref:Uncharacterized protein n=2 Tax=Phytophthora cactorum TaxID=29920 RepID=A0A329RX36_9STRA|nr:hypothetical protein PC114_g20384 [Phytophthora cactorum]KAG2918727.1 hypothetical protein PC117_g16985 [Phytophthora cactorum]KAG3018575.1 hypothetical protein PC120_g10375 [Phytophthora cactorum]KAG3150028.1 hypothetical protein C6341_g16871 [Phytophthora cactorum]KAG3185028.1 hypothetical protein PC128_g13462 [Phytophthora cactorum]
MVMSWAGLASKYARGTPLSDGEPSTCHHQRRSSRIAADKAMRLARWMVRSPERKRCRNTRAGLTHEAKWRRDPKSDRYSYERGWRRGRPWLRDVYLQNLRLWHSNRAGNGVEYETHDIEPVTPGREFIVVGASGPITTVMAWRREQSMSMQFVLVSGATFT